MEKGAKRKCQSLKPCFAHNVAGASAPEIMDTAHAMSTIAITVAPGWSRLRHRGVIFTALGDAGMDTAPAACSWGGTFSKNAIGVEHGAS